MQNYLNAAMEIPVIICMTVLFAAALLKRDRMTHQTLFVFLIFVDIAALTCDVLLWNSLGKPDKLSEIKFLWGADYLFSTVLIILFHFFMLALIREKTPVPRWLNWIEFPFIGVLTVLYFASYYSEIFFSFSAEGIVCQGELHSVSLIIRLALLLLDIVITAVFSHKIGPLETVLLLVYEAVPIGAALVDDLVGTGILYISISVLILIDYTVLAVEQDILLARQKQFLAEKDKRLADEQTKIMISQIQPHFLYNVISSIMSFCKEEPDKAVDALADFSDYLRTNMRSLSLDTPVPFSKELEHIRTYVRLEKYRFGDRMNVEYDIGTDDFFVPSLSIQPLIENAVKHGIAQRAEGGTVRLSTKRDENGVVLTVTDDGVGFDVSELSEMKKGDHIGIHNVSSRLEAMCGGRLTVESRKNIGTTAVVFLPDQEAQKIGGKF